MTTQPLKQILEQANLPWSEKLNDEWLFLDKDGNRIARADSIYHDDRTLILHSVNNLSRAIEDLKDALDFIHAIKEATDGGRIDENSIMRFGERLKTTAKKLDAKLSKTVDDLQTVQTP